MDQLQRAFYGKDIKIALLEKKEQEYEDFFSLIMQKMYGDNFVPVKAAGRDGDRKSDGFLIPEKHIFQVYAPSSGFSKTKLLTKINGDFEGAKVKWGDKMSKWTFVHNDPEGLPAYAIDAILALKTNYTKIEISVMGPEILKESILALDSNHLIDIFGHVPSQKDLASVTHEPIKTLLKAISRQKSKEPDAKPVPVNKLDFNELSDSVAALLTAGRVKEKLVEDLLLRWPDPEYGEDLASAFRDYYSELKSQSLDSDLIFSKLQSFAGSNSSDIKSQASSLAVLSYFFERCDIFENPPKGWVKGINQ